MKGKINYVLVLDDRATYFVDFVLLWQQFTIRCQIKITLIIWK